MDEWTKEELMNNFAARKVEDEVENKSMTNEEALSILHCPDTVGGLYSKKYGEALNMAMEALKREPCDDCISRQEVIKLLRAMWVKHIPMEFDVSLSFVLGAIDEIESVTPARPKGKWYKSDGIEPIGWYCSKCGMYSSSVCKPNYNFCPNCGVKMVEPKAKSEDKAGEKE